MSVQSVERAVALLIACAPGGRSLTDLATEADLAVSTAARLLATLCELAVVSREDDGGYGPGPVLQGLAIGMDRTGSLRAITDPSLVDLVGVTGETCGMSIALGDEVRYIAEVSGSNLIQVREFTNYQLPLHVVSSGLVILAHWPAMLVDRYLQQPLAEFTVKSVVDPNMIRRRLDQIRQDGFCWTREEFAEGISSVAAPVLDASGEPVAAIHCHGPTFRFDAAPDVEIQEAVVAAAAEVSAVLGVSVAAA
ncbi:MAG: IclR family transcriptional regulator [Acidimicrobiales bacterium]